MRGVSEVFTNVLLLLITVVLASFLFATFYNVYTQQQSRLVVESAKELCLARVVAVANNSGVSAFFVYNGGRVPCFFDAVYVNGSGPYRVLDAASQNCTVPPGGVARCNFKAPYGAGVFRLTGPRGETAEVRWAGP
ncbi:archaellin/type IV pilin N-terminal domain-containing protein [Pyrobaculum sp.]|uniref:archaellin/type IV pilin N-terminal domain-containing protein n=1 Tax=Pyrobaculum sp. TaxID=2004705 RepID=UPI003169DA25